MLLYGACRAATSGLNELRNAVFARAAHSSIRQVDVAVFRHVLSLDLSYHLDRRTGAVGKATDRGARAIQFVLTALVFNFLPTTLEVGLVTPGSCINQAASLKRSRRVRSFVRMPSLAGLQPIEDERMLVH
ncbi:hypothetical protein AAHC03_09504 [Spirometra sp. Aus1]